MVIDTIHRTLHVGLSAVSGSFLGGCARCVRRCVHRPFTLQAPPDQSLLCGDLRYIQTSDLAGTLAKQVVGFFSRLATLPTNNYQVTINNFSRL